MHTQSLLPNKDKVQKVRESAYFMSYLNRHSLYPQRSPSYASRISKLSMNRGKRGKPSRASLSSLGSGRNPSASNSLTRARRQVTQGLNRAQVQIQNSLPKF